MGFFNDAHLYERCTIAIVQKQLGRSPASSATFRDALCAQPFCDGDSAVPLLRTYNQHKQESHAPPAPPVQCFRNFPCRNRNKRPSIATSA